MRVRISRDFSVHDGGTKFYQTTTFCRVTNEGGSLFVSPVCGFTQWGKYEDDTSPGTAVPIGVPMRIGRHKFHEQVWEIGNARDTKRRRGYSAWSSKDEEFLSFDEVILRMRNEGLTEEETGLIREAFKLFLIDEDEKLAPKKRAETVSVPTPTSGEWGTW